MHVRPALTLAAGVVAISALVAAPAHAADVPTCQGRAATIVSTPGQESVLGTDGPDVIVATGARDLQGLGGDDRICVDQAYYLIGGPGRDRLTSTAQVYYTSGGDGADVITIGGSSDYVNGDAGNDVVRVATTNATYGGPGNDLLTGTGGGTLFGDEGFDVVAGTRDSQVTMSDAEGPDLYYGAGNPQNVVSFGHSPVPVRVDLRRGRASGSGTDHLVRVRSIGGSSHPDVMVGDAHDNRFYGIVYFYRVPGDPQAVGADVIRAGGGDDRIDAIGIGTVAFGQSGDDTIRTDALADGGRGADDCTATTVVRCEGTP
ncbi:MAG: hypothetical protein Q7T56_07435 [Nocardioidaceae bacterium]|nr:hypothetical protein [Nocardioidaceae bacterium]